MHDRLSIMLRALPEQWVPYEIIEALHGISSDDAQLWGALQMWSQRRRRPREVLRPDQVNRFGFETWMQRLDLLSLKAASARLGMTVASFGDLLQALDDQGLLIRNTLDFSDQVIFERVLRRLPDLFPDLQRRLFTDHNTYCEAVHQAIQADLDIQITPIYCATAQLLGETQYAYGYDALTDEPVGLRYQVWLDFGKPKNLRPVLFKSVRRPP